MKVYHTYCTVQGELAVWHNLGMREQENYTEFHTPTNALLYIIKY